WCLSTGGKGPRLNAVSQARQQSQQLVKVKLAHGVVGAQVYRTFAF
ncbi:MAG: hypothetical protein ACI9Y1_002457, partial [Lentisphaeria bacterium]